MCQGQQLLLAQRKQRPPVPLRVESARLGRYLFKAQFAKEGEDPVIGTWVRLRGVFEDLPQCARRQVGPLADEAYLAGSGIEDAARAWSRNAGSRPEQGQSRSLIRSRDQNPGPDRDRYRQFLEQRAGVGR